MNEEQIPFAEEIHLEGFQVVRRELFSHTKELALSFSRYRVYVNAVCLAQFENAACVQVLINPETHILALRPCREQMRDALFWCGISDGRRRPRQTTCKLFFLKIAALMGWSENFRYKLLGRQVRANGEALLVFDLTAAEAYPLDGKPHAPVLQKGWQNRFGLSVEEHSQVLEVPVFDGYSVFTFGEGEAAGEANHESIRIE